MKICYQSHPHAEVNDRTKSTVIVTTLMFVFHTLSSRGRQVIIKFLCSKCLNLRRVKKLRQLSLIKVIASAHK